jgi:hypothetical protein
MDELSIETGPKPKISVESQGKLYIKGWDRAEIRASASGKDKLSLKKDGENVTVHSLSHCEMRVPYEANLIIQAAHGETILKSITGAITVQHAGAGLTLTDVGSILVEDVNRDLNAHEVHGSLTIRHANRYVNASHIAGDFAADSIAAHLTLQKVEGNITAHVLGNATLSLEPKPGQTYEVEAHGVLTCKIPTKANASLEISGHGPIVTNLGGQTETTEGTYSISLGDGSAHITLTGYGPVSVLESENSGPSSEIDLEDIDLEMDTLSQQISRQVTEQIEIQMGMLEAQMDALVDTAGISQEKADRIRTRTQEKLARAQEKIARAQERAAQKIEMARRTATRKAERGGDRAASKKSSEFSIGIDAARLGVRTGLSTAREAISAVFGDSKSSPASDPVSDDERMMILNMLAEKKISIQEAEVLLAALEGRQSE